MNSTMFLVECRWIYRPTWRCLRPSIRFLTLGDNDTFMLQLLTREESGRWENMMCQEKEGKWVYDELMWAYRFLCISPGKWCVSCRTGTGIHLFLLRGCHLWFEHTGHWNRFKFNIQVKDQIQEEIETIFSSRKEQNPLLSLLSLGLISTSKMGILYLVSCFPLFLLSILLLKLSWS